MNGPVSPVVRALLIGVVLVLPTACRSTPQEPPAPPAPEPVVEPAPEPAYVPPEADWTGTLWTRDYPPDRVSVGAGRPRYEGFYLMPEGRLLLVNDNEVSGAAWEVRDGRIVLTVQSSSGSGTSQRLLTPWDDGGVIRLAPGEEPGDPGSFGPDRSELDLVMNLWHPVWLRDGERLRPPPGREVFLMLLPSPGGLSARGSGGINHFTAEVEQTEGGIRFGPMTSPAVTGDDVGYERLYRSLLGDTDTFLQVRTDLFFYAGTLPTVILRNEIYD